MDDFGYFDQSGMGVYTPGTQFDLDPIKLQSIGFQPSEIEALQCIVMENGKATMQMMTQYYGIPYEQAQKLKYMYDICTGRVNISTEDDLAKHLRRMFGKHRRIGISDLEVSKINDIPRTALVAGIPENTPFAIWNSKQYPPLERMYTVLEATPNNVTIETNRIPKLKWKEAREIDGVLKILTTPVNGKMTVSINKNYCRLCNRFVIVASLRRPEFHLGMVEIVCIEGTKVYVFADLLAAKKYSRYGNNNQRIYDFGYFPMEIKPKLISCASRIYKHLCGVYANQIPGNTEFIIIPKEEKQEEEVVEVE